MVTVDRAAGVEVCARQTVPEKIASSNQCYSHGSMKKPILFALIAAVGYPGAVDAYQVNFRVPSEFAGFCCD